MRPTAVTWPTTRQVPVRPMAPPSGPPLLSFGAHAGPLPGVAMMGLLFIRYHERCGSVTGSSCGLPARQEGLVLWEKVWWILPLSMYGRTFLRKTTVARREGITLGRQTCCPAGFLPFSASFSRMGRYNAGVAFDHGPA